MKNVRLILATTAVAVGLAFTSLTGGQASAQQAPQPAAVISITNLEQTLGDIDYLVDASGFGQMKFMIQTQITHFLKGIDQTRASGVLLYMDEGATQPSALGFVPVTELDDLLDTLAGFAEVDEGDDYTTIITDDEKEIFLKQVGDHAFITDAVEMFERIPDDPASYLKNLPERFNFAARVYGQRVPQDLRNKAIAMIRDAYEQQMEMLEEEDAAQAQAAQKNFELSMQQIESFINETDEIAFGMVIDQDNQTLSNEVEIIGLEGSKLAKSASKNARPQQSRFNGFLLPGTLLNGVSRYEVNEEEIEQYQQLSASSKKTMIDALAEETNLSDKQLAVVEKAIDGMSEVVNDTLAAGTVDAGVAMTMQKGNFNFAMGTQMVEPKRVEQIVKDLVAEAGDELPANSLQLNAGSHKGVTFHTITMPTPDDNEQLRDVMGDEVQIIIGIGQDDAYLAAGSDPLSLLKQAMDGPESGAAEVAAPLGTYNLFLAPIIRFAAEMEPNQPMLAPMAEKLTENGRDRLQYQVTPIKNGYKVRGDMQDGFMSMIQAATQAMGQGGGGQF